MCGGGLLSLAPWRDVNDPGDLPDMGRKVGVRAEPGEGVAEAGAGAGGERRYGAEAGGGVAGAGGGAGGERRCGGEEGLGGGMQGGAVPRFREGRLGQSAA